MKDFKETVKSVYGSKIAMGIILLAVGIGLIVWPSESTEAMIRVIGAALAVYFIVRLIRFLKSEKTSRDIALLILGIVILGLAISLIVAPSWASQFLYVILGAFIIIDGVTGAIYAAGDLRLAKGNWIPVLIVELLVIALGIVVIVNPLKTSDLVVRFMGASLIATAVLNFATLIIQKKQAKQEVTEQPEEK